MTAVAEPYIDFAEGAPPTEPFPFLALPDSEKEQLCRELLAEFGLDVRAAKRTKHGLELVHACTVSSYHQDQAKNPTASLNAESLTWHCFGCGSSGGLLWFICQMRNCEWAEARAWLEDATGLGNNEMELGRLLDFIDATFTRDGRFQAPIPTMDERMLSPWQGVHPYVTEPQWRGVPLETALAYKVGYAEAYPMAFDHQGRPTQVSERIILPHFWQGSLVGWQTRRLWDDGTPKFKSSLEFPKETTIYNYRPAEPAVVVEAVFSTLRHVHQQHYESTFGAAITEVQMSLLAKHPQVILWLDNDESGWKAMMGKTEVDRRGRERVVRVGLVEHLSRYTDVLVVDSPWAQDAADISDDDAAELIANAIPSVLWRPPEVLLCYRCKKPNEEGHRCVD
jgi:hypothetical protein